MFFKRISTESEMTINKLRKKYGYPEIPDSFPPNKDTSSDINKKGNDPVDHPFHYTYGKGLEVINVIDAFECGFEQGNVIKYVLRYKHKGGLQDLEKAKWYLEHLTEKEKNNSELNK